MADYAYIRVSTKEQNIDRQLLALKTYNIPSKNVYIDWQSGKNFDRPAYKKLIKKIKRGDLLVIKSIDRLGRNYNDILIQWQYITKELGADILVIDMSLLDTRIKQDNLTGTLIADLVLQILAYVAQTERESIHQRQAEGIAAARASGKKLGPKFLSIPADFEKISHMCLSGKLSTRDAAHILEMSHTTFYRRYKEWIQIQNEKIVSRSGLNETNMHTQNHLREWMI